MVKPKRTYKKSSKRRYYKRRYNKYKKYKKRYNKYKYHMIRGTPELYKTDQTVIYHSGAYDYLGRNSNGQIMNLCKFTKNGDQIYMNGQKINGTKIRMKYIYIKGYIKIGTHDVNNPDRGMDLRLSVYRKYKNVTNDGLNYSDLYDDSLVPNNPGEWGYDTNGFSTEHNILYNYEYKGDVKGNIKIYETKKHITYKNYNDYIPFKLRVSCNCVLQVDEVNTNQYSSKNAFFMAFMQTHAGEFEASGPNLARIRIRTYFTDY